MSRQSDGYWQLVEPYWHTVSIYDGGEAFLAAFKTIPVASQHLFATHWTRSEVRNGGFWQYCANSTGVLAPEARVGFDAIGMPKAAELVGKYLTYWGADYPRDCDVREEVWEQFALRDGYEEGFVEGFGGLDELFFDALRTENGGFKVAADAYALKSRLK